MLRKFGFSALVFLVFLTVAELASRAVESQAGRKTITLSQSHGWQQEFFSTLFDWHEPDPDLLWRFKAGLNNPLIKTNSDHLIGDAIDKTRHPGSIRILLLGDSSPVGLGLSSWKQSFGEILQYMLRVRFGGQREVEVINAAVSGYTSEQIARFLDRRGWGFKPDFVILYCGNNDASVSGPRSDREVIDGQKLRTMRSLLEHLALYRVTRSLIIKPPQQSHDSLHALTVRVSPDRFAHNLALISRECREHSCPLIVIKPPIPYLWPADLQFKIFQYVSGHEGGPIMPEAMAQAVGRNLKYCLDKSLFAQLYGGGDVFTKNVYASAYRDTLSPQATILKYQHLAHEQPSDPVAMNNLGVSYWESKDYDDADSCLKEARRLFADRLPPDAGPAEIAAGSPFLFNIGINLLSMDVNWATQLADSLALPRIYLDSALQADYFSLRVKRVYLNVIDSLSQQDHFSVVDLTRLFAANGGERLFIDHCHPTAEGHVLIAQVLVDQVLVIEGRSKLAKDLATTGKTE